MVNNSNFLIKEIPSFHAILQKFERKSWWKEQKKRCIEGCWSSGKWMPGTLYYYVNFHNISIEDEVALSRMIGLPFLRDIEWEKAYVYEEATGFSGFKNDDSYTCHRGALDILKEGVTEDDVKRSYCINKKTGEIIDVKYNNLFNKGGRLKKYIPAC